MKVIICSLEKKISLKSKNFFVFEKQEDILINLSCLTYLEILNECF